MDESQDPKPHPHVLSNSNVAHETETHRRNELSIWFFCGLLTLSYGIVLTGTGIYEHFGHQPNTILANLQPTLWWGLFMTAFGAFFTINWRPGKA
jgi:hypothetical protein